MRAPEGACPARPDRCSRSRRARAGARPSARAGARRARALEALRRSLRYRPSRRFRRPRNLEPEPEPIAGAAGTRAAAARAPAGPGTGAAARRARAPAAAPCPAGSRLPGVIDLRTRVTAQPRRWNLWDLERRARDEAQRDPLRYEEWSYLFVHLRQFATPDGSLPASSTSLVRESFGELLEHGGR